MLMPESSEQVNSVMIAILDPSGLSVGLKSSLEVFMWRQARPSRRAFTLIKSSPSQVTSCC